jgi:Concanavalin A-like lectin/glucanases superfamily
VFRRHHEPRDPRRASPITQVCTTAATYGDDAWHHAAGTLGAGGVNLYVDGVLAASSTATTSSTFASDTDFRLGLGHTSFNSATIYFHGDLDEVRVWSVELAASEIAANYMQTIDPATSGLQGYWMLEESGSSSVAHDATSGAHDGQLTNFTFTPSPWISPGAF